ncbi:RecQ family ATP-dependent DNA helicase [Xanthovirga aplysinae]|uniref:RecQ family ATP-dependent DNA helicase n=1 Tax=Xanthovirga aplysinae TaxID=2529853 RepID=UPI001FE7B293|nr:ATP-dependent DNA helicase RecQ [Xanthovirga aplysinae]
MINIIAPLTTEIQQVLKKVWGYDRFRPLQEEIINAVMEGNDVLAILPTGGGKSVCFQVPALVMEGICIVVSPLIALMKDQVEQLKKRGISASAVYSGMSRREIDIVLDNCVYGGVKFLYVSPERLQTEILKERVKKMQVSLLAVDEAHCISQWGYDFRPPYLEIADFRELIPTAKLIALTASATPKVQKDIQEKLKFQRSKVFQRSFARPNLSYSVRFEEHKEGKLMEILAKVPGSAIVYVRSRKRTQLLANYLIRSGIVADYYHAGLSNEVRNRKQEDWVQDKLRVIVATNAFGMGIDKANVRTVIHMDLPDTLEAYYQEAGRAGRDDRKAFAVMLYHKKDVEELRERILQAYPSVDVLRRVYQSLANYYKIAVGSSQLASYDFVLDDFIETFGFNRNEVYYSIKKLSEEGLIQLNESFFQPSRVHITVDHQKLYEFQLFNETYDSFIKALLRIYGGEMFSTYSSISERQLSLFLKIPIYEVKQKLKYLEQIGIISYDQQKDKPQLTFITPRFETSRLPLDIRKINGRKHQDIEKSEAVIAYVEQKNRCRTQLLSEYFGELKADKCGVCDFCVEEKRRGEFVDEESLRISILEMVKQQPLLPEELTGKLENFSQEVVIESIRKLLDGEELYYDKGGRLDLIK